MSQGVIVLVAIVAMAVVVMFRSRTTHFDCPNCGKSFKLSFVEFFLVQVLLTRRTMDRRYVTCPYCHTSEIMIPTPD